MDRFNTGNPIPSLDERDFIDNTICFDQAMNSTEATFTDRFGKEKPTIDAALKSVGFMPSGFDFVTGGTLQPGDRNKSVFNPSPNGDNNWYRWNGAFPKEIAAGSQPIPKDENNWVPVVIKVDPISRESLRRTYLEVGLNLVPGSFEEGGKLESITDILLEEKTGKCYSWSGSVPHNVNPGSTPVEGWSECNDPTRNEIFLQDFTGKLSDVTDCTAKIQSAISKISALSDAFSGDNPSVVLIFPAKTKIFISGTILIPSFVQLNLNGCRLRGTGANVLFESGFYKDGGIISNFGQTNETKFVVCSSIYNGMLKDFNIAFKLFNFCENSFVDNIRMVGVNQAVYGKRCFYSSFTRIHSRSPLDGLIAPCFFFDDEVNAVKLDSNFAVSYNQGWQFSGKKDNVSMTNCGAESCPTGIKVSGNTSNFQVLGSYFENNYNAIDFDNTGNHHGVVVDGCWFHSVTNALQGATILSGRFTAANLLNDAKVNLPSDFSNRMVIEIPDLVIPDNEQMVMGLPANYILGDGCRVVYVKTLYNHNTGKVIAKANTPSGVIPHYYSGTSGKPMENVIPFCVGTLLSAGTVLEIETKIEFTEAEFIGIQLTLTAGATAVQFGGIFTGGVGLSIIKPETTQILASNNNGYYKFTVTGLVGVTSFRGSIRIL